MQAYVDFTDILDNAGQIYQSRIKLSDCPEPNDLIDLVYEEITPEKAENVHRHLAHCESCKAVKLNMAVDRHQWELSFAASPNRAMANALGSKGRKIIRKIIAKPKTTAIVREVSALKDAVVAWISLPWEPKLAGQMVTALDVSEQKYYFDMDDGEYVELACRWEGEQTNHEPQIDLSWSANIFTPDHIWVCFTDSTTKEIIGDFCLGDELEGMIQITVPDLTFDPTLRKWAVQVVIEAV